MFNNLMVPIKLDLDCENGFTLLELLIVIAVLGIMSFIVVIALPAFLAHSYVDAANDELMKIRIASYAYASEHDGIYPDNSDAISGYISGVIKSSYSFNKDNGIIDGVYNVDWPEVIEFSEEEHIWKKSGS